MHNMPMVVLLAGGIGESFAPFETNKVVFPFLGKPFIFHVLSMLEASGFTDVCIVCNKENKGVIEPYPKKTLRITLSVQENPDGMADALLGAKELVEGRSILVLNGVDYVEQSLFSEIMKGIEKDPEILLVGKKVIEHTPAGYFVIHDGLVTGIIEKPAAGKEPSDLINLVFHYFKETKNFFSVLENTTSSEDDRYEQALSVLLKKNGAAYIPYTGPWSKLKYPHLVLSVMEQMLPSVRAYIHPTSVIAKTAVIEGDVYVDEGAKIMDFAVVKGPAYIGKNSTVGNHALVRASIVEHDSVIGSGSEVARSYIGPLCMLHHNFVGDSVLEKSVNPSYGTCFTNMRLDGNTVSVHMQGKKIETMRKKLGACIASDVFFGANCTVMPGVTIGSGSRVYPSTVVNGAFGKNSVIGEKGKLG